LTAKGGGEWGRRKENLRKGGSKRRSKTKGDEGGQLGNKTDQGTWGATKPQDKGKRKLGLKKTGPRRFTPSLEDHWGRARGCEGKSPAQVFDGGKNARKRGTKFSENGVKVRNGSAADGGLRRLVGWSVPRE